jgi:Uma2 family endonuclease
MTTTRPLSDPQSSLAAIKQQDWPTMYDLPSEDPREPGLPDEFHDLQPQLLSATLRRSSLTQEQLFTGSDLNLYYDLNHPTWYKRPDWFAVVGVPRLYQEIDLRMSYVTWDEQVNPFIVVELISPGTAMEDLGEVQRTQDGTPTKWQVYEEILKIPYYVVYNRYKNQLFAFKLIETRYQALEINDGRIWLPDYDLGLGLWQGDYQGITRLWLRWCNADGQWLPTEAEQERQGRLRSEQQLEQEQQRSDRLAAQLRALGIEPTD